MKGRRSTKNALISSILVFALCVSMLIGATFAWFTDTASTSVNKIQAGTLDVELLNAAGNKIEGDTLKWQKAAGHESERILWEPGCEYNLESFKIKNNGSLALKYKIIISGIDGDAELNSVIDWTYTIGSRTLDLSAEGHLTAGQETELITITGHMQESAGNDYQGDSIDGISITVVATQDTVENDSIDNRYDAAAEYPVAVAANVEVTDNKVTVPVTVASADKVGTTPVATVAIPAGAAVTAGTTQLELTVDEVATPANFEIATTDDSKTFEVDMKGLNKEANTELFKVSLYVGTGLEGFALKHNGNDMTKKASLDEVTADQDYYYNADTGVVTFLTKTFSPFTATYNKDSWANHAAEDYSVPVANNTITISNAAELALFAKQVNAGGLANYYKDYTVKLATDIDLGEYLWQPIGQTGHGQFAGTFDGQGYTISNLTLNNADEGGNCATGLFGWLNSATVKNLNVDTATVSGHHYVGVIAGYMETAGCTIQDCAVSNATISCTNVNSEANGDKCGVIVGHAGNTGVVVSGCTASNSTVSAGRDAGQIVGAAKPANVSGCSATNVTVTANGTGSGANIRNDIIGREL